MLTFNNFQYFFQWTTHTLIILTLMSILYARAMDDTNLYMKFVTRLKLEGG